jgi:hypothetical protein
VTAAEAKKFAELALLAGIAVALVYLVRKFQQGIEVSGEILERAQSRTTDLIEHFFPLVNSNSMITHAVTFPDGRRHAVPGESVNDAGYFMWQGAWYRLMVNTDGRKIAVAG